MISKFDDPSYVNHGAVSHIDPYSIMNIFSSPGSPAQSLISLPTPGLSVRSVHKVVEDQHESETIRRKKKGNIQDFAIPTRF